MSVFFFFLILKSFWYCAMDVSPVEDFVIAGRNNGMTAMCTTSGQPVSYCLKYIYALCVILPF